MSPALRTGAVRHVYGTGLKLAGCACLHLLIVSCGSSPSSDASAPSGGPVSTFTVGEAPSGPFDVNHRDDAILAAKVVLQREPGHPSVADEPVAVFQSMFTTPQVPGQPLSQPDFGWNVTFKATFHRQDGDDPAMTALEPTTRPHISGTGIPLPPVVAPQTPVPDVPGATKRAPNYISATPSVTDGPMVVKNGIMSVPEQYSSAAPNPYVQPRLPGMPTDTTGGQGHIAAQRVRPDSNAQLPKDTRQVNIFISVDGKTRRTLY